MGESSAEGESSLFRVNADSCIRCGACVWDCAFQALKTAEDGLPVLADPKKCMRCQHCLAICPKGAVSIDGCTADQCIPVVGAELPTAKAVENWLALRRSVRHFADVDVDSKVLESILETLGNTPTGCNAGALTLTCFSNRRSMATLREAFNRFSVPSEGQTISRWLSVALMRQRSGCEDLFFRGASGLLIVSSDPRKPSVATPLEDVTIACSNFELLANAHGIGTCWCGFLGLIEKEMPGLLEKLAGIPTGHPFVAMLFGHSAVRYSRGVVRKGLSRIVYR